MLSGIGDPDWIKNPRVALPGVGKNLQDRYEVGVISEMTADWTISAACTYGDDPEDDPCLAQWLDSRTGVYTSGGAITAFIRRSVPDLPNPDLFVFGLASHFQGYFPLWFSAFEDVRNHFTWAILKGQTQNSAGTVKLRSADPRATPLIDFHYFEEGNNEDGSDLDAVADAVLFAQL